MAGYPTDDTFSSMRYEVITMLQGYGVNNDQVCTLTAAIGPTDTSFTVDAANIVSRGVIEIDQELMWVQSASAGNVVVPAWGRGWKGTTAASHALNSAVFVSPTYPQSIVAREVNNALRATYPTLFAVGTTEILHNPHIWQYGIPAEADRLLSVEYRYDIEDGWHKLSGWELTHSADTTDFPTGKMISISQPLPAGSTILVRYAKPPTLFVNDTDLYSATGLPASSRDCVVLGAASRLLPWLDSGRLPTETVASDEVDQVKPIGNAIQIGREIRALYAKRMQEEQAALVNRYPLNVHKVR